MRGQSCGTYCILARYKVSSAAAIQAAFKRGERRVSDGDGLYILAPAQGAVQPGWRFDYTFERTRKTISLGVYPDTDLALARQKADECRRQLAEGKNPSDLRKAKNVADMRKRDAARRDAAGLPATDSFEAVARELHQAKSPGWSPRYGERWLARMQLDLFPMIGRKSLTEVTTPMLLGLLREVEKRSPETAHTLLQTSANVFAYGIMTARCERNPAAELRGALRPVIVRHMAAILDPRRLGDLMASIHDYPGQRATKVALLLSALTFQRPYNVRAAKWTELDLDAALWRIPAASMKRKLQGKLTGPPHLVPLSRQAVDALLELRPYTLDNQAGFVFPGLVDHARPMSENTVNLALRRLGFNGEEMSAHGFRATARTLLVERVGVNPEVVEAQLAHAKAGPLGAAYDRAAFLSQRRMAMQAWADYLDQLRGAAGADELMKAPVRE
ncbi:MAG TPA: integrase arm-type DNA-binding domain-containing protein [Caldimonas sp.]|jgi:integrase|nr:integrase arm-type DNA-binding domain-containing protein [Caldimonas sp.]HEX2541237.1 integrase arm-type DNA-binding domain-containing protein [Caldimonas sp.]